MASEMTAAVSGDEGSSRDHRPGWMTIRVGGWEEGDGVGWGGGLGRVQVGVRGLMGWVGRKMRRSTKGGTLPLGPQYIALGLCYGVKNDIRQSQNVRGHPGTIDLG